MSFDENVAIQVDDLSKCYQIYDKPGDRLKQFLFPRLKPSARRNGTAYFREFWALRDVSLTVKQGETIGIVGRNGSGKSTLLQIICGTLTPTRGDVRTNGRIAALLELGSGFNPEFSGRENVYLNAAVLGLTKEETDARFDEIAAFADINDFIDQPIKTYSSGMVVRLAFAVAINADPQILVVDEALSVGDELFQRKCFARIEQIRARGATILFVSHSGATVVELCDRAVLLDSGEQLAIGSPKHIVSCYQKLLYAPADRRADLREAIKAQQDISSEGAAGSSQITGLPELDQHAPDTDESYDPSLRPVSTMAFESHGALIDQPAIYTLDGKRVNNIVRGGTYLYRYHVYFAQSASNVRFGMMIKTTSGIELGGSVSAASPRTSLPYVEKGSDYQVEFKFDCRLAPGVYFLNAGASGEVNGAETYLHRLVDVAMFRVQANGESTQTGVVDFSCHPEIKKL
ncbi:ABC transporter ATP-binding protein [Achromobacter xylosoxidans]|uniref:ABC transporter ATP-binding protein n=1 Tax=Alcaligenes xylosoxydans xylosoxydans TaxID=85698 RepID=UPI001F12C6DF|nr:ABC transporter ATP-binding protein [Achromobacter xylosoxidans]